MRDLYLYLITNFSQSFSYNRITQTLKITSPNTTKNYIHYLEEIYFAITVPKFEHSIRKQLVNDQKFYVSDIGFIPHLTRRPLTDRGWILENIVCDLLVRNAHVYYFQEKIGCDFVTVRENKVQHIYQVCYELNVENETREIEGLIECLKALKQKEGYIMTYNQFDNRIIEDLNIKIIPVWFWALNFKII